MSDKPPPNVLVFFTDQQRWDTCGLHGNPLGLTPNFDRLASSGTHLAQSFTCQPICGPARACLQTGQYATHAGVWRNGLGLSENAQTLGTCFRQAGYSTGYIGKWHLAGSCNGKGTVGPVPKAKRGGYDYWLASEMLEFTSDAYDTTLYDEASEAVKLPGYRVDAMADAGIRFLNANRNQPFFLFLSFLEPHQQNHSDSCPAPPGYEEAYEGRWMPPDLEALESNADKLMGGYCGMVKRLDEALGRVQDALMSLGLDRNTIVLFTSDHACHFRSRNQLYKHSSHEASIRVPTAFWGGPFNSSHVIDRPVSLVDLPPTLLQAAGLDIPAEMDGHSILPLLKDPKADFPEEAYIQISEMHIGRAIRTARWKYEVANTELDAKAQAHADVYHEYQLYDLEQDPHELSNLVASKDHTEIREELRERLLKRMRQAGEPKALIQPAIAA